MSIGLAAHEPNQRMEDTLANADRALYHAKHLGRNRVECWQEQPAERLAT